MLNLIDNIKNSPALVIVPCGMDADIEKWKKTWNPQIPGQQQTTPEELIDNYVIEEALKTLTNTVNLSTGLSHPRDKDKAVELFHILIENNELYDPDSIRAWALRNGWMPSGADQLKNVAQAILDGKRLRRSDIPVWRKDLIEFLRKKIKNKQEG